MSFGDEQVGAGLRASPVPKFTVLGGSGFIGSHLVAELRRRGAEVAAPGRQQWDAALAGNSGHILYCAGLTADFRSRPLDTVRAHVSALVDVLDRGRFESVLYLSSTRLYGNSSSGTEQSTFHVDPSSGSDFYNLSKLMGESLCLSRGDGRVRVARLSNVYGPDWESDNFVMSVVRAAVEERAVELRTGPQSSKDYVSIDDVVPLLLGIAQQGTESIYNVASGICTSNEAIADVLQRLGVAVTYHAGARDVVFPPIDITRIRTEFAFNPRSVAADLPRLIEAYRRWKVNDSH